MWVYGLSAIAILLTVALIALLVGVLNAYRRQAREAGYTSLREYLRAAPRTEQEKRDAVDLALRGLVICALGLLFPPLLLIGLIPLYYGARKTAYASMGFGLFDDAEPPSR